MNIKTASGVISALIKGVNLKPGRTYVIHVDGLSEQARATIDKYLPCGYCLVRGIIIQRPSFNGGRIIRVLT